MRPLQKIALFNLIVITLAAGVCLFLLTVWPPRAALSAFALTALLGFGTVFARKEKGKVLYDERDKQVGTTAQRAGFFIFWLYFIAACVIIPFAYNHQPVPSYMFGYLLWGGLVILMATQSVATLVLYRRDSEKSGKLLDSFRNMTDLQKGAYMGLIITSFVLSSFIWFLPLDPANSFLNIFTFTVCLSFGLVFVASRAAWKSIEIDEQDRAICQRAVRVGYLGLGLAATLGSIVLGLICLLDGSYWISLGTVSLAGLYALAVGLLAQPLSILVQCRMNPGDGD
ncbi:MAG: hypothetical protein U9P14_11065 [Gemmatimonadota bacterium]|nr:hypothetical protein [Gemmatimonadota bacterium]